MPGLLYSLTTFLHYQGDIMQCGLGKPFNIPSSKLGEYPCPLIGQYMVGLASDWLLAPL